MSIRGRYTQLGGLLICATVLAAPVRAQDSLPSLMERTGAIRSNRLREASGAAVSRRYPGVLWTHNDSGDKPLIYAVSMSGELLATYRVPGAKAVDWEDVALARCPDGD